MFGKIKNHINSFFIVHEDEQGFGVEVTLAILALFFLAIALFISFESNAHDFDANIVSGVEDQNMSGSIQ